MAETAASGSLPVEALAGITVLDLTDSVAGQFCARLFADSGAQVTLVEPVTGSRLREGDGPELFTHLNLGKSGVALDIASPAGVATVRSLAEHADVVVIDTGGLASTAETVTVGRKSMRATEPSKRTKTIGFMPRNKAESSDASMHDVPAAASQLKL